MRRTHLLHFGLILSVCAIASCAESTTGPSALSPQYWEGEEEPGIGRMTGGGGQVTIGDVYVTRGFTLHCDITLSNNLEINWPGNKWHLDKPLTSADCVDDPAFEPAPPPAPFDTFIGEGVGRLNGVDGYTVRIRFIDAGEPGGKNDMAGIQITDPNGNPVLLVPLGFMNNGNLQAHYDQPHK